MGFLKKKSATRLSDGDRTVIASKASNGECRDDASTTVGARPRYPSRSRSDSDSFKTPFTPPRGHRRSDSQSTVSVTSPSKLQTIQRSVQALPKRPSLAKGKGGQQRYPTVKKDASRGVFPKSRRGDDVLSVSSSSSSDDSDDDSEGSDASTRFSDEDGNRVDLEDTTMGSTSIGYDSTDTDDEVSIENSQSVDTNEETDGETVDTRSAVKPTTTGMWGGIWGWNAREEEAKEVGKSASMEQSIDELPQDSTMGPPEDSGLSVFLKKMEAFTAKSPEHQLIMQVTEHGNIEKLALRELPYIPEPHRPTEIVIKVDCSTVSLQDCMIRRGKWYDMQKLPFTPGSDFIGTIHEIGSEASRCSTFKVGDRVTALVPSGGNARYITIEYDRIMRVPSEVDSERALCLSSTYVPARQALDRGRKMNTPFTGANILVIGGNGPSGLAAIELALLEGAHVFTTADERHHEHLTKLGAKCFPIDPDKWLPLLKGKMDVVLDSVCLDGYNGSRLALNSAGTLVCTGMSAVYTQGATPALLMKDARDYMAMYFKAQVNMWGNAVYYDRMERFASTPNEYAQLFHYMCHLASKGTITPLVSTRASLNKVASLQRAIELGDTTYGILVCSPWTTEVAPVAK